MNVVPKLEGKSLGPTNPLRQTYNQLPWVVAPFISTTRNTRSGRGMIVPVTAAANTPVLITHNLGRLVQGMIAILNNAGASYTPGLEFAAGTRSPSQQTIQANLAMTNCLVWVF